MTRAVTRLAKKVDPSERVSATIPPSTPTTKSSLQSRGAVAKENFKKVLPVKRLRLSSSGLQRLSSLRSRLWRYGRYECPVGPDVHRRYADLSGQTLDGLDRSGADLSYANLADTTLINVNLSGATVVGIDLSNAPSGSGPVGGVKPKGRRLG